MQFKIMLLLVSIFSINNIYSQSSMSLSASEAVKIGLENNKNILINESKVRALEAKVNEVNTQLYPSLSVTGSYTRLSKVEPFKIPGMDLVISPAILNNFNSKISLQQPIFTGFRINSSIQMNEALANAGKYDSEAYRIQLISNIKTMYWNYFKLEKTKKSLQDNVNQLQAHINDVENYIKAGLSIENDLLKVKVQKANLELSIVDVENNIDLAGISLATLMGIDVNTKFIITDNPENINEELIKIQISRDTAVAWRPEIKAMDERINASKYAIEMTKSTYYPQIFLIGNYNFNNPNQRYMPMEEKFKGSWDVTLSLSYNLFDWGARNYQTEQAEESLKQAELSKNLIIDGLNQEVSQSVMNYNKSFDRLNATKVLLEQARENLRVTQEKYRAGAAISSELLDAETSLLSAEISLITAQTDYQLSLINYNKAIGFKNY